MTRHHRTGAAPVQDRLVRSKAAPPLLEVEDVSIGFGPGGSIEVVQGVSFSVRPGRTLAIVGESGSGKSVTGLAIMGLLDASARVTGRALLRRDDSEVIDLLSLCDAESRTLRGRDIAMVFQEPMTALNPVLRIGDQLVEVLNNHGRPPRCEAKARAIEMLRTVGIPDPERNLRSYPHELSGGMRQRVMIAMALMLRPALLIADEPTTALDVTIQAQILLLLRGLQSSFGMALVFITHDLGVVGQIADDVAVMYSGRVVETGPAHEVLAQPRHPYTRGLLHSAPQFGPNGEARPLTPIPGTVPLPTDPPAGCRFHTRCGDAVSGMCDADEPLLERIDEDRDVRCLRWREIA